MLSPEALADALLSTYLAPGNIPTWSETYAASVNTRRETTKDGLMFDHLLRRAAIDSAYIY